MLSNWTNISVLTLQIPTVIVMIWNPQTIAVVVTVSFFGMFV